MSTEYESRITRITLSPPGADMSHERTTTVEIDDDGGGEFFRIRQSDGFEIRIDPDEWSVICSAVDVLMGVIRR